MSEINKGTRLSKAAKEFNVGITTIVDFLAKKGHDVDGKPNTKIPSEMYEVLMQEFQTEKSVKEESKKIGLNYHQHKTISIADKEKEEAVEEEEEEVAELIIKNVSGGFEPGMHKKDNAPKGKPKDKPIKKVVAEQKPVEKPQPVVIAEEKKEPVEAPVQKKAETIEEVKAKPVPEAVKPVAAPEEPKPEPVTKLKEETPKATETKKEIIKEDTKTETKAETKKEEPKAEPKPEPISETIAEEKPVEKVEIKETPVISEQKPIEEKPKAPETKNEEPIVAARPEKRPRLRARIEDPFDRLGMYARR
jgi:translation initiation factor IF-2